LGDPKQKGKRTVREILTRRTLRELGSKKLNPCPDRKGAVILRARGKREIQLGAKGGVNATERNDGEREGGLGQTGY